MTEQHRTARYWGYAMAILGPCAVQFLFMGLIPADSAYNEHAHLLMFIAPILVAAYLGGLGAGLLSTASSCALVAWNVLPPLHNFSIASEHNRFLFILLVGNGILVSAFSALLHKHRSSAERAVGRLNAIARALPGALYSYSRGLDGKASLPHANDRLVSLLGLNSLADFENTEKVLNRIHPDDVEAFSKSIDESQQNLSNWSFTFRTVNADGHIRWVEAFSSPTRQPDGSTVWTGFAHDVTKQKETELAVKDLSERWRFAIERSGIGIWEWDITTNKMEFSPTWKAMLGFETNEIGNDVSEWKSRIHPDDATRLAQLAKNAWSDTGSERDVEYRLRHKNGSYVWVLSRRLAVAWGADGKPTRFVGTHTDIDAIKQGTDALREREARLRVYVEASPIAQLIVTAEGQPLDCNPAMSTLLGYARDEIKDMALTGLNVTPARATEALEQVRSAGRYRGVQALRHREGHSVWTDCHAAPLPDGTILISYVNITAQRNAEQISRIQGAALEAAANMVIITDTRGFITWANQAFCVHTGYTKEEVIGKTTGELIKSGAQNAEFYLNMWITITQGNVWRGQVVNRNKNGARFVEDMVITPIRDDEGNITNFIAIKQDITERVQMEAQLLRTQRLESVGRLASGIAHDLNNILTPILMAPDLLRDAVQDPEAKRLIDSIETSAVRGANIIRQLLLYGRGTNEPRAPVSLRNLIRDMNAIIQQTFPKNIRLSSTVPDSLTLVHGNATQLHQVLMNLCVNARDAMRKGGTLKINAARTLVDSALAKANPGTSPGPHIRLTVEDTGEGIAEENLTKIFDPYFTTKGPDEGTGLGLSTTLAILRQHHGFLVVDSEVGHGSAFHVYLPALEMPDTNNAATATDLSKEGTGQRILVVDDEPEVCKIMCRMLGQHGYEAVFAANPRKALELFAQPAFRVDAMFTDIMMPGMDGIALAKAVHAKHPELPIITMTGHDASKTTPADVRPFGIRMCLQKPISLNDTLTALNQVLRPADRGVDQSPTPHARE